jgi:hypothetical protein
MRFWELFSTPQGIAAQIFGFIAMGIGLCMFAFRERKRILLFKMFANLTWVVHYALLGAASGAAINAINAAREGVFYHKGKKWASYLFWPFLFIAVNAVSTVLSWQGPISLLPMVGSTINIIALWCDSTKRLRLLALPSQTLWLIYSIAVSSLPSTLFNAFSIISLLWGMTRERFARRERS